MPRKGIDQEFWGAPVVVLVSFEIQAVTKAKARKSFNLL